MAKKKTTRTKTETKTVTIKKVDHIGGRPDDRSKKNK